jgi:hypothetical protein
LLSSTNRIKRNDTATNIARFKVLTAVLVKIQIFWDVTPCRLVIVTDVGKERGACILRTKQPAEIFILLCRSLSRTAGLEVKTLRFLEMSEAVYQAAWIALPLNMVPIGCSETPVSA